MKKLIAIVLALTMVIALAACGSSSNTAAPPLPTTPLPLLPSPLPLSPLPPSRLPSPLPKAATWSASQCPPRICSAGTRTVRT